MIMAYADIDAQPASWWASCASEPQTSIRSCPRKSASGGHGGSGPRTMARRHIAPRAHAPRKSIRADHCALRAGLHGNSHGMRMQGQGGWFPTHGPGGVPTWAFQTRAPAMAPAQCGPAPSTNQKLIIMPRWRLSFEKPIAHGIRGPAQGELAPAPLHNKGNLRRYAAPGPGGCWAACTWAWPMAMHRTGMRMPVRMARGPPRRQHATRQIALG